MTAAPLVAGVELGGTKMFVLRARGREIFQRETIPTTSADETLGAAAALLRNWWAEEPFAALGIASFGPLRLDRGAADFGHMLPTPKPGWSGADIFGALTAGLPCPAVIDTDVNGAALAELRWGAGAQSVPTSNCLCYLTIGTGFGGGFAIHGRPLHGAMHPEVGHIQIRRAPGDDPRWDHVAHDIAQLVSTLLLTTAARQVLIGGGVGMGRADLLDKVRAKVVAQLNGYLSFVTPDSIAAIVRSPALGDQAGPLGAVALALDALEDG